MMIYDSFTREKRPFVPIRPGHVSIYVCGVTPYAQSHLGHARPSVVWDVIKRYFIRRGYYVHHVQNFTDIDDKIVLRAQELGTTVGDLATRYMMEYTEVMNRLGVAPPDFAPRVTENIESINAFIAELITKGMAYATSLGDVYFRVNKAPHYGQLSGRQVDEQRVGVRVESSEDKEHPADFALWKAAEPLEPGFDSPWGHGRPGWHIECSVMASRYLGPEFDLHGGGIDLIFPHHENELAQSQSYYGVPPARCWVHNGLITRGNVKMSKSLGNGIGLNELLDRFPAMALRTYLLSVHYRNPLDFSEEALADWNRGMERIWELFDRVKNHPAPSERLHADWADRLENFEERLLGWLDDDFNTARALAEVFEMVRDVRAGEACGHVDTARGWARINLLKAHQILGILPEDKSSVPPQSESILLDSLLEWRQNARDRKDFAEADRIRQTLAQAGWTIEDTSQGPRVTTAKVPGKEKP